MRLGKAGWLQALLANVAAAPRPAEEIEATRRRVERSSGRGRARAHLRHVLRESGLLYGTPAREAQSPAGAAAASAFTSASAEEQLFLAVVRTLARVGLEIAELADAPAGPRREQLLLLFALFAGRVDYAAEIDRALRARPDAPVSNRLWSRVEDALAEKAISLAGDPVYGLVLHNGAVYADAHAFGRHAIDYFVRGRLNREAAEKRVEYAARQKLLLVEVLTALACAERAPSFPARRAILRQIEDLKLPSKLEAELKETVRKFFERRPRLQSVVKGVRSRDARRFILEQTLLSSLVDARRAPRELALIRELATLLGMTDELPRIELELAEFYAQNRQLVDVFTVSPGAELMGEEMVESMQRTARKNFQALLTEIRETGELSVLLTRAARGHKLSADERRKMREQLIDMAKAIPALAIFAAPGGVLLLIALAKVLPFSLLPSAFQAESEDEASGAE